MQGRSASNAISIMAKIEMCPMDKGPSSSLVLFGPLPSSPSNLEDPHCQVPRLAQPLSLPFKSRSSSTPPPPCPLCALRPNRPSAPYTGDPMAAPRPPGLLLCSEAWLFAQRGLATAHPSPRPLSEPSRHQTPPNLSAGRLAPRFGRLMNRLGGWWAGLVNLHPISVDW